MKIKTLLDQYKLSLKTYDVSMPMIIVFWVIASIVAFVKYPDVWLGLIFLSLGVITAIMFVLIRKYLKKKIQELQEEEEQKQSDDGNAAEGL